MNHVCQKRWVAVCLLFALLGGADASAQFLRQETIEAQEITDTMRQEMLDLVTPAMEKFYSGDPADLSDARKTLTDPHKNPNASAAFREAFSEIITPRLEEAVTHDSVLLRINAMIVAALLTDADSKALVDQALKDDNPAVQRKAMEAIRKRVQYWLTQPAGGNRGAAASIDAAVKQVNTMLEARPAPDPIIITPGLLMFLDINSTESLETLIGHINDRLALHAEDPSLSYAPEQAVIERVSVQLTSSPDAQLASATNKAAWRYASLIIQQIEAEQIDEDRVDKLAGTVGQCLLALGRVVASAGESAPSRHVQFRAWVEDQNWDALQNLLQDDWVPVLKAVPFSLRDQDLEIE